MESKGKIIDTFTKAHEGLSGLSLPNGANAFLRQMQRAFVDLRHHDSAQAKIVEEAQTALAARDKKVTELHRETEKAIEAGRAKDAKIISQAARISALESEVKTLGVLIRKRLMPKSEAEREKSDNAFQTRLEAIAREFIEDCNPSPAVHRAFHRCGKLIMNQATKDIKEMSEALDTYQHLVSAICLKHGKLTLPASLPDGFWENAEIKLVKLEDGWTVEVNVKCPGAESDTSAQRA